MSSLNIGESGLTTSTSEDFYEIISRKRFCGTKFKCNNGRCISKSSVCNGKNDCLDNSDEAKCLTPLEHFIKLSGGKNAGEGNIEVWAICIGTNNFMLNTFRYFFILTFNFF